ncbi:MAG: hypothetical protein R3234_04220, partial [Thermoanaerobaculia bacterium]|nr:hypothetical protein [Thermoanaerobaculia bacterium]
ILMPGNPLNGARYYLELAPGAQALDRAEVRSRDGLMTVPAGTFANVLHVVDTTPLEPGVADDKYYAYGWGLVKDAAAELISVHLPECVPDDQTLCLQDGRFRVTAAWKDFEGNIGPAFVHPVTGDSGEMWFFRENNVELVVKVLDGCVLPDFRSYWVFAAGLTNVEVWLSVVDTQTDETWTYHNPGGEPFGPVLDVDAFASCP